MLKTTIAAVLGLALSLSAQVSVPSPVIGGTTTPVTSSGHQPGESVTLDAALDPSTGGPPPYFEELWTDTQTADANGVAHFDVPIPNSPGSIMAFGANGQASPPWTGFEWRTIVSKQQVLYSTAFSIIAILLQDETVYWMEHVAGGEQFLLWFENDAIVIEYL